MRRLLKIALVAILIMAAASWMTTIAYGHTNAETLNADVQPDIRVEAAPLVDAPAAAFYGNAIGGVTAGDLFYVDSTNVSQDIYLNLYLTNTDELIHVFRYLTHKVGVYYEVAEGQWEKAPAIGGGDLPYTLLTMRNGVATFTLPGLAKYKVTIDSGSFNCHPAGPAGENIAPLFYLEADII
jgi:hypothetical protein